MTRKLHAAITAGIATFIVLVTCGGASADVVEPWSPCLNPADCALPWNQRERLGLKLTQCWKEAWCRNWLENIIRNSNRPGKRDIFMSRGWGAGGMPFSVLYLNSHLRLKQQQQKLREQLLLQQQLQQQQREQEHEHSSARQPRFSQLEGDGMAARTAALVGEQHDYNEPNAEPAPSPPPPQRLVPHKQYAVLPQLFISYGWGPLG